MAATTRTPSKIGIEPREVDLTPIRSESLTPGDRAEMSAFFREQRAKNDSDPIVLHLRKQLVLTKERTTVAKEPITNPPVAVDRGYFGRITSRPELPLLSASGVHYVSAIAVKSTSPRAAAVNKAAPASEGRRVTKAGFKPTGKKK